MMNKQMLSMEELEQVSGGNMDQDGFGWAFEQGVVVPAVKLARTQVLPAMSVPLIIPVGDGTAL